MKASMWIRPFLFVLVVLVAPIATYYVYFVESRETLLLDRFHAHLANAGAQTEARLTSAFNILRNNSNQAGVMKLDEQSRSACPRAGDSPPALVDDGAGTLSLWLGDKCRAIADAGSLVANIDPERRFHDIVILSDKGVVYQRDTQNGRIDSKQLAVAEPPSEEDSDVRVTDPLGEMRVSYQGRAFLVFSQPLHVAGAGAKPTPGNPAPRATAAAGAGSQVDAAPADTAATTTAVSDDATSGAGGKTPAATTAGDAAAWRIVGLLEEDTFNGLKWRASSANIAIVALILLGLLLGGPFLKLWYLGRFEPLSRFDVLLLIGAGLGLVGMLTVALLAWDNEMRLTEYADRRLAVIAQGLGADTRSEIEAAVDTLYRLEPRLLEAYDIRRREGARAGAGACPYLAANWPTVAGDLFVTYPKETATYRPLVMSYLMDADGCQLVKWSSAAKWTEPGQFGDRNYFRSALPDPRMASELYRLGDGRGYFQEVIFSRTTGERELVFSKPVGGVARAPCENALLAAQRARAKKEETAVACVSVLTGRFHALESALPPGYGAMLVKADTEIAWSSDQGVSSELNLAKELDAPERLQATVSLATVGLHNTGDAPFDADYRGSPHRFLVAPLGVSELALVVFYDRSLVLTTVLESAGVAVVAWVICMSAFGLLVLAFWFADDMTERGLRRAPALLCLAVLALGALASFKLTVPALLIIGAIGVPLPMLLLLFLARTDRLPKNARLRRSLLVLATWVAVLMAAALPMAVFYDDASQRTLSALERFAADQTARADQLRRESFERWRHRVGKASDDSWQEFVKGQTYPFSFQDSFQPDVMTDTLATLRPSCTAFALVCRILYYLPDYSDDVAGRHAMYRAPEPAIADRVGVKRKLLADAPPGGFALFVGAACLFAALLAVAIWYLMARLFGLHAENVVEIRSFVLPTDDEKAHWLVYGSARTDRENKYFEPLAARAKRWIDLRDERTDSKEALDASLDAVAFDEFDSGLNDIATVRQRVELLERLLQEKHRVILLFVSTDPLNFVISTHHAAADALLVSRFAGALARFKVVYAGAHDRKISPAAESVVKRLIHLARRVSSVFRHVREPERRRAIGRRVRAFMRARTMDEIAARRAFVEAETQHPDLWDIGDEVLEQIGVQRWTEGQIVQQVQSRAHAIYQRMWSQCTRAEKFTLIELARGNPINPNNWDAARRLRVRGYVRIDPFYRIGSESLRQFVLRMAQIEDVRSWNDASPGAWTQIKVPLLVMFVGTLIFLGVTQPNMFNSVLAFLAAGAASAPFLFNALNARLQRAVEGRSG